MVAGRLRGAGVGVGVGARFGAAPLAFALLVSVGCSANSSNPVGSGGDGKIEVVAAEGFWGSVAAQLGGDRVDVTSIISSPDVDPHSYEPTPRDGRAIAGARYVIFNGLGYDGWASQAVEASPASGRKVLDIGKLLKRKSGDNPHRWYFPPDVHQVIAQISDDYKAIDPTSASYFDQQRHQFESVALKKYDDLLAQIKNSYSGLPVGASESIFVGLAQATGLKLLTPPAFMNAVSEGTDPTPRDKATTDAQIVGHQVKVFVFNRQNSTPDVQALANEATASGIPVATITETPPVKQSFQDWQSAQLESLSTALQKAAGT